MRTINCPSCGAEGRIDNPASVSYTCPYCDNIVLFDKEGLKLSGKSSRLSEGFSRLYRGATGAIDGKRFYILGRVRYSFGRGFWDEWLLDIGEDEPVWLTEDNYELSLQSPYDLANPPAINKLKVGKNISLRGLKFRIQESGKAKCIGIEGELPRSILPDEEYLYVDGSSLDGKYSFGIEFDDDLKPACYIGTWLTQDKLVMDENDYGW